MKKSFIFLSSAVILTTCINGCTMGKVSMEKIEEGSINDQNTCSIIDELDADGVYTIDKKGEKYVIFMGSDYGYKNIKCRLNDNILEITAEKDVLVRNKVTLYRLNESSEHMFDMIKIELDGKEIPCYSISS